MDDLAFDHLDYLILNYKEGMRVKELEVCHFKLGPRIWIGAFSYTLSDGTNSITLPLVGINEGVTCVKTELVADEFVYEYDLRAYTESGSGKKGISKIDFKDGEGETLYTKGIITGNEYHEDFTDAQGYFVGMYGVYNTVINYLGPLYYRTDCTCD